MDKPTHTHLYIVTGSSRGLGRALVAGLLGPGHRVLGMARHQNAELAAQAQARSVELTQWTVDLAEPLPVAERLAAWLQACRTDTDAPPVASATLINNAGLVGMPAALDQVPLATLQTALRAGLEAALLLSAGFLSATASLQGARRVMNISSGLGRRAMAGSAAYCAAKAGMDHFSRAVALEQTGQPHGARIVSIAPGVIDTDMQVELRSADPQRFPERSRFAQLHAQGQLMSAEACATKLLAYLHSDAFGAEAVTDIREI